MYSYQNIGMLLTLERKARILFHGPDLDEWYQSFSVKYKSCIYDTKQQVSSLHRKGDLFDLIVLNTYGSSKIEFSFKIKELNLLLKPNGFFIVLGPSKYCLKLIIKKYLFRQKLQWQFTKSQRKSKCLSSLKKHGFKNIYCFTSSSTGSGYSFLAYVGHNVFSISRLYRLKFKERFVFYNYLFIGWKNNDNPLLKLLHHFQDEINNNNNNTADSIGFDKIEFRSREGLIIYLRSDNSSNEYIVRSSNSDHVNAIIEANTNTIKKIYEIKNIPATIINVIPKQASVTRYENNSFYIEEKKEGHLAWQIAIQNSQIEKKIFQNAVDFIINFNEVTRQEIVITEQFFNKVYRAKFESTFNQNFIGDEVRAKYYMIVEKLEEVLLNRKQILVWSHGDYGYGNILVDKSGNITGVIDWDTAKKYNYPGYDLFNLAFSRYKTFSDKKYIDILDELGKQCLDTGHIVFSSNGRYENEFCINKMNIGIVIATFGIGWVSDGARYRDIYNKSHEHIIQIFSWVLGNCFKLPQVSHPIVDANP